MRTLSNLPDDYPQNTWEHVTVQHCECCAEYLKRITQLESALAEIAKPVTDEEWIALSNANLFYGPIINGRAVRDSINRLIAARAKSAKHT